MKYTNLLWMMLFFFLFSSVSAADCKRVLKVGWEYWPPYQYIDKQGELLGLDVELLKAIANEASCEIQFYEVPWKRHLLQVQSGKLDIAMGASFEKVRAQYAFFSAPTRQERVSLVVLKSRASNFGLKSLADISRSDFNLGITRGYYYGEEFKQLMNRPTFRTHVESMHSDQINYHKLFLGRIDGFLVDPVSMAHQYSMLPRAKPLSLLFDVNRAPVHLMFSKASTNETILDLFNTALQSIKDAGTYQAITDKYLSIDKPSIDKTISVAYATSYPPN